MALTAETKTDLYRFFAIAFDAAPGVTYMNQLAAAVESGMTVEQIVEVFTSKTEFTSVYPNFFTQKQFATKLVETVVGTAATAAAKAEAVADIEAALAAGYTRGKVIFQVFNNLAKLTGDAKWGGTADLLANQVAYAQFYTEDLLKGAEEKPVLADLRAVIASVTPTTSIAAADISAVLNPPVPVPPQTFTLTTGVDTGSKFVGGTGDDTFIATSGKADVTSTAPTLTAGDSLDGGLGTDTMQLAVAADAPTPSAQISTKSIEAVSITNNRGAAYELDATLYDGLAKVAFVGGTGATTVSNSKTAVNVDMTSVNNNVTITPVATAVVATDNKVAVSLNAVAQSANVTLTYNGIETMDIAATGTASGNGAGGNDFRLTITDTALKTATITGAVGARLGLTTSGATGISDVGTVNGSAATGDLDLVVTAGNSGKLSVTGGAGSDRVTVGAVTKDMTVTGGNGTDTIVVSSAAKATTGTQPGANVSGFEVLEVSAGGSASMAAFAGSTFTSVTAKGTATVSDVGTAALTVNQTPAAAGGTLTVTRATNGAADTATVNLAPTTSGTFTGVSVANEDTLTISSGGNGANVITTLTGTDLKSLTVTGARGLTVTTLSGGTALNTLDASGNTGTVLSIDASASTVAMTVKGSGGAPAAATDTLNTVTTGSGSDSVTGSAWIDSFTTGAGNDTISAGAGNDIVNSGIGNDVIDAGEGDNNITADAGNDSITAGAGNDTINAGAGADTVNAGAGDDRIAVSTLTDNHSLVGGDGSDRLATSTGTITAATLADATFINTTESIAPKTSSINTAYIKITEASSSLQSPQTLDLTNSTGMGTLFLAVSDTGNNGFVKVNNFDGTAITLYGKLSGGDLTEALGVTLDGVNQAALAVTLEDYDTAATTDTFTVTGVQALTLASRSTSQFSGSSDQQSSLGVVKADSVDTLTISTSGSASANATALTLESVSASLASAVTLTAGANDTLKITAAAGLATGSSLVTSLSVTGGAGSKFDIDKVNLGTSTLTSASITVGEGGAISTDGDTTVAASQMTDIDATRIVTLTNNVAASAVAQLDLSGIEITTGTFTVGAGGTTVLKNSLGVAAKDGSFTVSGLGDLDFDNGAIANTVSLLGATVTFNTSGLSVDADGFTVNSSASTRATITTALGADSITGGAGNDVISTGLGADTIVGGAGNDSVTITESLSAQSTDVVRIAAVVATSSDSARVQNEGADGNDTGGDSITGFDIGATRDVLEISATNVVAFVHGTHTTIGSAGTGATSNTGAATEFTKSTLLIQLDSATSADAIAIGAGATGDIAVTFSSMTNDGVAVSDPSANEAAIEGRIRYNLTGTAAANTITGGGLADTITGGAGADSLTGAGGADTFAFASAASGTPSATVFDTIVDYVSGTDFITYTGGIVKFATNTAAASGTAGVAAGTGVVSFNAADNTQALRIVAVANALGGAAAGNALIFTDGTDSFIYITDGVAGVGANDVLIRLVGLTGAAVDELTVAGGNISGLG